MKKMLLMTALVLLLGVTGCMTSHVPSVSETKVALDYLPAPQPPHNNAHVGKAPAAAYRPISAPERYTVSMIDMDVRAALAALSQKSNVPIVAEPGVVGMVNIVVADKTVAEILLAMIRPLGYSATVDDGMIVVGQPGLITRAFYLNYLKDKRSFSSVTNASISSGGSGEGSAGGSSGGGQGNVQVTTAGGSDFWPELLKGLELIVFDKAKGNEDSSGKRIVANSMSGVVYVTDTADNMKLVSAFLADVEREIKRQVLIQAHIIEVDLDKEFSLGLDWSSLLNSGNISISQKLAPANGVFTLNINSGDFNLMLDAMKKQGHVNMLSSPKISAMNNQKAVIKLTTKEVSWINQETFRGETSTTSTVTATPQIDEVGLFLDVTPNISHDGVVTMHVHPSISEIKKTSFSSESSDPSVNRSSKPVISVREIDTIAEVMSGQTVVIAGLIVDRTNEEKTSVPLLGDIPYLGLAFSNFRQVHKKSELVIFLTPFVLDSQSIDQIREQHEQRLQGMEELSRFIETRERAAAGMNKSIDGVMKKDAVDVPSSMIFSPADSSAPEVSLNQGELPSVDPAVAAPRKRIPAVATPQWVTPPPQRADGK